MAYAHSIEATPNKPARKLTAIAAAMIAAVAVGGCGHAKELPAKVAATTAAPSQNTDPATTQPSGNAIAPNPCKTVTKAEIAAALGDESAADVKPITGWCNSAQNPAQDPGVNSETLFTDTSVDTMEVSIYPSKGYPSLSEIDLTPSDTGNDWDDLKQAPSAAEFTAADYPGIFFNYDKDSRYPAAALQVGNKVVRLTLSYLGEGQKPSPSQADERMQQFFETTMSQQQLFESAS